LKIKEKSQVLYYILGQNNTNVYLRCQAVALTIDVYEISAANMD